MNPDPDEETLTPTFIGILLLAALALLILLTRFTLWHGPLH